ncbi:hypothetical protein GR160_09300 [Flavobacterium sp. Sd200]|uniref:hypothetical protein n=1 Tax=Flavobacterium sp. Sd200 TaxID=2692211 RepID=UPI00136AC1E5|nr:hypothetical protein [Flavobacterium sp. Sd200]MXN91424.1 hypothetical protein [Flavobacterium sp. Sd200]
MKTLFFSLFVLISITAAAQTSPVPTVPDTITPKTESLKPDVRNLGKASTTTTITETRKVRRKKKREEKAHAKTVQQYTAPKDTVAVKNDTITIYKKDSIK